MSKSITFQSGWVECGGCCSLVFTDGEPFGGSCIFNLEFGHIFVPFGKYVVTFEGKGIKGQVGWRYCRKCSALFFANNETKGVCPKDHGHHDDSESGPYELLHTTNVSTIIRNFYRWRWCRKCEQLFRPPSNSLSFCPRGGPHDSTGSGFYYVQQV